MKPRPLDLGYAALAVLSAPWWLRKRRSGWRERFGAGDPLPEPPADRPRALVHAVSVGETNLVRPLVDRLARDFDVVVSVTTDTGLARARSVYAGRAHVVRYPLDASWAVDRFLDRVAPDVVALAELELWPGFVAACRSRGAPVAVVNGRLSARSFRNYRRARPLLRPTFAALSAAAVQDAVYAERFAAMGVPRDRVSVVGTMKWDAADPDAPPPTDDADELARALGVDRSKPLVVAGSTEPAEHALLHAATPPGAQLLCAPRKPEWFDAAARDLPGCVRRSSACHPPEPADRFLLDTIGELRAAYALADLVVVGRSFGELYGSDPMEPAALGKPIVMGPRDADFAASVRALEESGGLVRATRSSLPAVLGRLLGDDAGRARMGAAARACVREHRGASDRCAAIIRSLAGVAEPPSAAPAAPPTARQPEGAL